MRYATRHARLRRQSARSEMAGRRACRRAVRRSTTRKAARTASCMATRPPKPSCPRSSAPRPGPASATGTWNRSTNTAPAPASGGCTACSPSASVPVTVYGVATALARSPDQVAAMQEAGWEIASHGLKWIDYRDYAAEDERARHRTRRSGCTPRSPASARPAGTPAAPRSTPCDLAAEEGGFDYVSDTYDDDLPYWLEHDGRPQLIIPYTLDANDMRFATPQGFNSGDQFFAYLKDSFDTLYAEGKAGAAAHDDHRPALPAGRPARPRRGAEALHRLREEPRQGLAAAPHRHRPPLARDSIPTSRRRCVPRAWSRTSSSRGSAASSSIRPGSPSAPSSCELGPAHDSAGGLHNALCRAFRAASDERAARRAQRPSRSRRQAGRGQAPDRRIRRASRPPPGSTR